jgi:hypothetical protein
LNYRVGYITFFITQQQLPNDPAVSFGLLSSSGKSLCCPIVVRPARAVDNALRQNHLFFECPNGRPQSNFDHLRLTVAQAIRREGMTDVATKTKYVLVVYFP